MNKLNGKKWKENYGVKIIEQKIENQKTLLQYFEKSNVAIARLEAYKKNLRKKILILKIKKQ